MITMFSRILGKKKKEKKKGKEEFTEEDEAEVLETLRDLQYID